MYIIYLNSFKLLLLFIFIFGALYSYCDRGWWNPTHQLGMYHILLLFLSRYSCIYYIVYIIHYTHVTAIDGDRRNAVWPSSSLRHRAGSCVRVSNIITRLINNNRYDFKVPKSLSLKRVPNISNNNNNIEKIIIYMR